jgi:hypothetical protein
MPTYSPTYRAIAAQFLPLQHGHATLLQSNPALVGSCEPVAVLANVLNYGNLYWLTRPGVPCDQASKDEFTRAVVFGSAEVARYNQARPVQQHIYCRPTHAAALALVWQLASTHYGVADAQEQVEHEGLRRQTESHRAKEEQWAKELADETEVERQAAWDEMQPELAAEARANRAADAEEASELSGSCLCSLPVELCNFACPEGQQAQADFAQ